MLLTLTARSLSARLKARGASALPMSGLPRFAFQQTGLRGLVLDTALLKGWGLDELDALRTQADQAGCPCLLLRESEPTLTGVPEGALFSAALKRIDLVARAANRLGCNALSIQPRCTKAAADEREFDLHTVFFRRVLERVDRLELNVLIEPSRDWIGEPSWLIELVKKVGGFRIGTLPTFEAACRTQDCVAALRQTAPYAGAVLASFGEHDVEALGPLADEPEPPPTEPPEAELEPDEAPASRKKTKKTIRKKTSKKKPAVESEPSRLPDCIAALRAVGYEQILALDYQGAGDAVHAINGARRGIEAMLETA
ncbi:MAG: hypothetical protein IT430_17680 [Phycisphaerales bacterium]|nr:hypothetical protein [Phycisphaerales bacterium]